MGDGGTVIGLRQDSSIVFIVSSSRVTNLAVSSLPDLLFKAHFGVCHFGYPVASHNKAPSRPIVERLTGMTAIWFTPGEGRSYRQTVVGAGL